MENPVFEQLRQYLLRLLQRADAMVREATDGLADEQLYYQPTKDTNSIAWLAWHLSRRREFYSAVFHREPHVWVTGGWAARFGMDPSDVDIGTGMGFTPDQVAAFRPPRGLLFGYVNAVCEAAVDRVSRLTLQMMGQEYDLDAGRGMRVGWTVLNPFINDSIVHSGQIAYIRGMVSGFGWQGR